jgi:hypothetical protein
VKTGSFRTYTGPGRISIARWAPRRTPAGYRIYNRLAPGPWFNSVGIEEYCHLYSEILKELDPKRVYAELVALVAPEEPVLLCWDSAAANPPSGAHNDRAVKLVPSPACGRMVQTDPGHRRARAAGQATRIAIIGTRSKGPGKSHRPATGFRARRSRRVTCRNASLHPHFASYASLSGGKHYRQPLLARERLRYVAEPIAAVFATDPVRRARGRSRTTRR